MVKMPIKLYLIFNSMGWQFGLGWVWLISAVLIPVSVSSLWVSWGWPGL